MKRSVVLGAEMVATLASATLTGLACCGPILIQWLGLAVWLLGGRTLLFGFVRYEIPVLGLVAGAAFLGRVLARDRVTRWANTLLAVTAASLVVLRVTWEVRRGVVMALDPVIWLFSYRQTVLLVAAGLVFVARLALLLGGLWRRVRGPGPVSWPGRRAGAGDAPCSATRRAGRLRL
ncbi:MAG: hypothetical protein M3R09_07695 [Actinomycetota bacterium]|nr:hypothetical protein [Actinomycetota bacterium]